LQATHLLFKVQIGVLLVGEQSELASHSTHMPLFEPKVAQTFKPGVVQSFVVHARHVYVLESQIGVAPAHPAFVFVLHATHAPFCAPVTAQYAPFVPARLVQLESCSHPIQA